MNAIRLATHTPLTIEQLIPAMAQAYERVMGGSVAPPACLATFCAQGMLESGNGTQCYDYGIGNVKPGASWSGLVCFRPCNERLSPDRARAAIANAPRRLDDPTQPSAVCTGKVVDGEAKEIWCVDFWPPHPESAFRAYETLVEGCVDYLSLMLADRYRDAWAHAYRGDAGAFVRAVGAAGYFTANVDVYAKAVVSIASRIRPACDRVLSSLGHGITDEDREHIASLVALTITQSTRDAGTSRSSIA